MKTYIGTKFIKAEPQPKDGEDGYKVVYPDGYESWSPKAVFEEAYYELPGLRDGTLADEAYLRQQQPTLKYFDYRHLPERLQPTSKHFHDLALAMAASGYNDDREVAAGLRKLLEAKDCFVGPKL